MTASPRLLVLLLVALHLQCLYAKYYLVETEGEAVSEPKKNTENTKHVVASSKTSKAKIETGRVRHKIKKNGRVRRKNLGVDYLGNQQNPGNLPYPQPGYNTNTYPNPYPGKHPHQNPRHHGNQINHPNHENHPSQSNQPNHLNSLLPRIDFSYLGCHKTYFWAGRG